MRAIRPARPKPQKPPNKGNPKPTKKSSRNRNNKQKENRQKENREPMETDGFLGFPDVWAEVDLYEPNPIQQVTRPPKGLRPNYSRKRLPFG